MEFDHDWWQHHPGEPWLIKQADDRVWHGRISGIDEERVTLREGVAMRQVPLKNTDWIRPLLCVELPEWTVLAGFQAEDTTFDTWWIRGSTCLKITYSEPLGFEEITHVIDRDGAQDLPAPSAEDKARARQAIHDLLVARRPVPVPPLAHLQ